MFSLNLYFLLFLKNICRIIDIFIQKTHHIILYIFLWLMEQIPKYPLTEPSSSTEHKQTYHTDTGKSSLISPLFFSFVDSSPSIFPHTVPEIFSPGTIFTLQRQYSYCHTGILKFSVIIHLVKQCVFICIPKIKSGEIFITVHGFQRSPQHRFLFKNILEPFHVSGFHIYNTSFGIQWKRPFRHCAESKIRRKKICDLVFSAYDIYFFKEFQYFLLFSVQYTLPHFYCFGVWYNYMIFFRSS